MDGRFAAVDGRFAAFESKMDGRFAAVDGRFVTLEAKMDGKFNLLAWMLGVLIAAVSALVIRAFA
jgi:hypothetical protein